MKSIYLIIILVVAVVGGILAIGLIGDRLVGEAIQKVVIAEPLDAVTTSTTLPNSAVGSRAGAFTVATNYTTTTRLVDLLDQPLIVVFWATWQERAVDQLRAYDDYLAAHKNNAFNILFLNYQEDTAVVKSFLRRSGYDLPIGFDESGAVGDRWQVHLVPTTFIIGTDGLIKDRLVGNYQVQTVVDKLLNINH